MIRRMMCNRLARALPLLVILLACGVASAHKVDFGPDGTCRVDGKPFFPIGIWVYGLDTNVMADLHEHRFNTVIGNSLKPTDLPLLEKHGMMCTPYGTDDWIAAAKDSPSLPAREYAPAFSPDSQWIAYVTWSDAEGGHVWKAPLTGEPQRLEREEPGITKVNWRPDGSIDLGTGDL